MMKVYLDHAATTPVFPEVAGKIHHFLLDDFGNPSSSHDFGQKAKETLEQARGLVASLINAPGDAVYFTSGGTEADNLAIFGTALHMAKSKGKRHIITSAAEHHAVLESCEELAADHGFRLTVLPVDRYAMVQPEELEKALTDDTALVSIMHVNNEVGTINPIRELADITHRAGAFIHVDAVQSVGKIACDVEELSADLLSISSHKINGPKGVGALYIKPGVTISKRAFGGNQESAVRSGTENMPGIVGFGEAARLTGQTWQTNTAAWQKLRDRFVDTILKDIPYTHLNGHPYQRVPHNAHISFAYTEADALLDSLNIAGIACSAGSACHAGEQSVSHVLQAMDLDQESLISSLRFSFGHGVDDEQVDYVLAVLKEKVAELRAVNPFYPRT